SRPGWCWQGRVWPAVQAQDVVSWLSAVPLQSLLELEVQSRALGSTLPEHAPQLPFLQVDLPDLQMPTVAWPQSWVAPFTQGQPSLATPLQLLSLPGS